MDSRSGLCALRPLHLKLRRGKDRASGQQFTLARPAIFHFVARTVLLFTVSSCERQLALLASIQPQPSVWTGGGIGRGTECPANPEGVPASPRSWFRPD